MDDYTLQGVKEVFGRRFQQYCINHKIILKRKKYDIFMTSLRNLEDCINILDSYKQSTNKELIRMQYNMMEGEFKQTKIIKEICCAKYKNSLHTDLSLQIQLFDTSNIVPSCPVNAVSLDYILNTAKTGYEIYDYIIKKTMEKVVINDETSIPFISNLLSQFQKRHTEFDYNSALMSIIEKKVVSRNSKCEYGVPLKQIMSFYTVIFAEVVPFAIFGKLKNLQKVRKALRNLLLTPYYTSYDLMFLIEKLDISSITWLRNIQFPETQRLILAKFIKWFFCEYLIKILYTYFHVTSRTMGNNERLYIARSNWFSIQKKFVMNKIRSNALQLEVFCDKWGPPIGIYKLRAKHSSVRPIVIAKHTEKEKSDLVKIFKFLKQLQITEYGFTNFEKTWKSVVQHTRDSKAKKSYFVSCDVKDAFGSIIQGHLYDIIISLCKKLPEVLNFSTYAIKSKYRMQPYSDLLSYIGFFSNKNLQLPLPPGTLYACTFNSIPIKKSWLLDKIWQYISYNRVKILDEIYIISKGIVQGTKLSSTLSEIYLSHMVQKEMSSFLNCGKIIRYVDDILYITDDEMQARQFLQLIKKGIPNYNCYFKELKIQSNIINMSNTVTNNINYIGYQINCDTLEVAPKYSSTHLRYLMLFNSKDNITPLILFKKRLCNVNNLRLSKLVLDSSINSTATIMKILVQACYMQAKRAKVLIKELFGDTKYNVQCIICIIKYSNMSVAKYVIKLLLKCDENMSYSAVCKWNKSILNIIWMSYKFVFRSDKVLRKYIRNIPFMQRKPKIKIDSVIHYMLVLFLFPYVLRRIPSLLHIDESYPLS